MGSQRRADEKAAGTDVGREPATAGRVFWSDSSKATFYQRQGRVELAQGERVGEVSEAGHTWCGEGWGRQL